MIDLIYFWRQIYYKKPKPTLITNYVCRLRVPRLEFKLSFLTFNIYNLSSRHFCNLEFCNRLIHNSRKKWMKRKKHFVYLIYLIYLVEVPTSGYFFYTDLKKEEYCSIQYDQKGVYSVVPLTDFV